MYELDENDELHAVGEQHRFDEAEESDGNGRTTKYYWEQHFDLIYPDKDDIVDDNDNFDGQKFEQTVAPFISFLEWITDVGNLRNTGNKLGDSGSAKYVT
jgi:hypothetical protein